jgi:hypothetical protein
MNKNYTLSEMNRAAFRDIVDDLSGSFRTSGGTAKDALFDVLMSAEGRTIVKLLVKKQLAKGAKA